MAGPTWGADRRQMPCKELLHRFVPAQQDTEVVREPEKVLRLECPVPESVQPVGVSSPIESADEFIRAKTHALAEIVHLRQHGFPAAPGKQRSIYTDNLPVARIVEPVGNGDGVPVDKGRPFEMANKPFEVMMRSAGCHAEWGGSGNREDDTSRIAKNAIPIS